MKKTKTLLEKFAQGLCTKEEEEEVFLWLEHDKEEESSLSMEELVQIKSEMWFNLSDSIHKNQSSAFNLRTMASLAVAASLVVAIFISGVSKINTNNAATGIGQLEIASGNGIIVRVDASTEPLKICFDGYIQFANKSTVTTTITYGVKDIKTFQLIPGKTYYMGKFKEVPYILNEDDMPLNEDPSRHLRGDFSIDCHTA
ncbi:MAG: hypothetical protein ABJN84_02015 [Flavobacteriaceae bacterium]